MSRLAACRMLPVGARNIQTQRGVCAHHVSNCAARLTCSARTLPTTPARACVCVCACETRWAPRSRARTDFAHVYCQALGGVH